MAKKPGPHPGTVEVSIVSGTDICVVKPGIFHLGAGNNIRLEWKNSTGGEVVVYLPEDDLDAVDREVRIPDGNTKGTTFRNPRGTGSHYSYAVYCCQTKSFAVGGSEPEMIVP